LGGLISLRRLQVFQGPYAGAVLSAPWLATALPDWLQRLGSFLGLALPVIPLPSGIRPQKLTRDPQMARAWHEDPLKHGRVTPRLFREVMRVQKETLGFRGAVETPLLFLIPGADPLMRSTVTETFARGIVGGAVRVEILPDSLHEPLNDLGREELRALVVDWLVARTGTPPEYSSRRVKTSLNLDER
jgi:lysophospholipase